jgi:hypothetical protein
MLPSRKVNPTRGSFISGFLVGLDELNTGVFLLHLSKVARMNTPFVPIAILHLDPFG